MRFIGRMWRRVSLVAVSAWIVLYVSASCAFGRVAQRAAEFRAAASMAKRALELRDSQRREMGVPGEGLVVQRYRPVKALETTVRLSMAVTYGDEKAPGRRRYKANFQASYKVKNPEDEKATITLTFPYPTGATTFSRATVLVKGEEAKNASYSVQGVTCEVPFEAQEEKEIRVNYDALGDDDFFYALDHSGRIRALTFELTMSGVRDRPVLPKQCLAPTEGPRKARHSYQVRWVYKDLVTDRDIIIEIPKRLIGARPFSRWPIFAAVGLVLFALLLYAGAITTERQVAPAQLVLAVLALLAFYPLFLYLAGLVALPWAFLISLIISGGLVISYLRGVGGRRFALTYGGTGVVVLLGVFSLAGMLSKGTGILLTLGGLVLLLFAMRTVSTILERRPPPAPKPPVAPGPPAPSEGEVEAQPKAPPEPTPVEAGERPGRFCAFCGEPLPERFQFCPACGKAAMVSWRCPTCGTAICTTCGHNYAHCPGCGGPLPSGAFPAKTV